MTDDVFGTEAPKYWARDLPVVPVEPGTKRPPPEMKGWQGNLAALPSEQKRASWLSRYPKYGIGLLLGKTLDIDEVLVALDVDDDRLMKLVQQLLGLSEAEPTTFLAGKRGKKGATIFARAPKSLKPTAIKGAGGLGNIDFLASGRMTVMPPSLHPDTGKPYEVIGASLLDIDFNKLPEFSERLLILLRATIGSEYASVIISGEATHDAGVGLTGVLVHVGASDDEIAKIFVGLLPDNYSGNSLEELPEWIKSAHEKGFDAVDKDGEKQSARLVKLALREGIVLFRHAARGDMPLITLPPTGPAIAFRVNSSDVRSWLRHVAYRDWAKPVGNVALLEAVATLEAIALYERESYPVFARVAGDHKSITIDLGRKDGQMVQIEPEGWRIETTTPHKFMRGAGFDCLPLPKAADAGFDRLRELLGLSDLNYRLLLAFLINALKPDGPFFILLIEGEQGSGKSFFCEIVKRIIDPNKALRLRLPDKPQDLMIHAKEYWLLSFDNTSGMRADMSDMLCSLATGGGFAVRRLYTDDDLHVLNSKRPFMINGISGFVTRPDLMERAIPIKLPPMPKGSRKTEAELNAEFDDMLPGVLAKLYDVVGHALKNFDRVDTPRDLRMIDGAKWIRAAERGLNLEEDGIVDAIAAAQDEFVIDRVNDDALVMALRAVAYPVPFVGYVGELFVKIVEKADRAFGGLPRSPSQLSKQLDRMRPAMAMAGVIVEFLGKDSGGRRIRVSCTNGSEQ